MNYYKIVAVILTLFSIGSLQETYRILTSNAPDIANNRSGLIPMALIFTSGVIGACIYFWKKSKQKKML